MQAHRFFLPDVSARLHRVVDLTALAHQLRNVLRLGPGDVITLLDDSGDAFPTQIMALDSRQATGRVLARQAVHSEPAVDLTLYQCALKGERFEWVLQKGTELGVRRFVPVISSRTVVRPAERLLRKYDRWRVIIRETAEQSGRGRLPTLAHPLSWDEAVQHAAGLRLLPWEEAKYTAPGIAAVLTDSATVALLIGPEGGIGLEEAASAMACGWKSVSLGPRILRAETAAVVALSLVLHEMGALG